MGSGLPKPFAVFVGASTVPVMVVTPPPSHCTNVPASVCTWPVPHWLGTVPPQICGGVHVPQLWMRPPQPSPTGPQLSPSCAHVLGTQSTPPSTPPWPHWFGPAPPQNAGATQLPQLIVLPQPSPCVPQVAPSCAHVLGVHGVPPSTPPCPHLFAPPPPQNAGAVQLPQLSVPPHSSPCVPQVAPSCAHVFGTHVEPPSTPPWPHL